MEIWKDIKGYEGLYQVSNMGRVKTLNYNHTGMERVLKESPARGGYKKVILCRENKCKTYQTHRLVAEAFIPNPEGKPCTDHINTIRTDNRVENLRWVTRKENSNNPLTRKHISEWQKGENSPMWGKFGKLHHNSIPIIQLSAKGNFIREWDSIKDAQRELGINNIYAVLKGRRPKAGGYRWMYKN